jgi:hypothetical protein
MVVDWKRKLRLDHSDLSQIIGSLHQDGVLTNAKSKHEAYASIVYPSNFCGIHHRMAEVVESSLCLEGCLLGCLCCAVIVLKNDGSREDGTGGPDRQANKQEKVIKDKLESQSFAEKLNTIASFHRHPA